MKTQSKKEKRREGRFSERVQKGARRLSFFLQQRSSRLSLKELRTLLILGVLTGTACCSYVVWRSLQPSDGRQWLATPIKAFPLPPPTAPARSGSTNKDTLHQFPHR